MLEVNHEYSGKELAKEMGISNETLKAHRKKYEDYLQLFFKFITCRKGKGNGLYYTLTYKYNDFIPYKQYMSEKRKKTFQEAIVTTIENKSRRQTGSNLGRILNEKEDIKIYDLSLDTITGYVRVNLKELLQDGFYQKSDYQWCCLKKDTQEYELLSEENIKELRSYFNDFYSSNEEEVEKIWAEYNEGNIALNEAKEKIGQYRLNSFAEGCAKYAKKYNTSRPIKVPVYEAGAFYDGKFPELRKFIVVKK